MLVCMGMCSKGKCNIFKLIKTLNCFVQKLYNQKASNVDLNAQEQEAPWALGGRCRCSRAARRHACAERRAGQRRSDISTAVGERRPSCVSSLARVLPPARLAVLFFDAPATTIFLHFCRNRKSRYFTLVSCFVRNIIFTNKLVSIAGMYPYLP